jgi:hypothetical protein
MKKGDTMHKLKVPIAESKFVGVEPIWADDYEPTNYEAEFGNALNWYNYIVDMKDCRAFLSDWFKGDTDKLKSLAKIPDKLLPRTYANTARIAMRGFPINEFNKNRVWEKVQETANKRIKLEEDDDTVELIQVMPFDTKTFPLVPGETV